MRAEEARPDFGESGQRLMYRGGDKEVVWDKGGGRDTRGIVNVQ